MNADNKNSATEDLEALAALLKKMKRKMKPYEGRRGFTMRYSELRALAAYTQMQPFEAIADTFEYGFAQGVRYQKAQEKKGRR